MLAILTALVLLSTAWCLAGVAAVVRVRRRHGRDSTMPPEPLSVLKPLCGVDNDLEANLRTFFEQDHPDFELVFGVQGEADPALALVRRLRESYPRVRCQIVIHDGGRGINPKVSNLRAALTAVRHDVIVISDSNVTVEPDYLRAMGAELSRPGVGLVTSLFAGTGERTLGASLENLHLNGEIAAGIALPTELLGYPLVVGKSMMFRRSVFERLGGFASVANVLAEDYVIGRMFHSAGKRIALCPAPVRNISATTGVRAFFRRHLRWGMIRLRLNPLAFAAEPLTRPFVIAAIAALVGVGGAWPLLWAVALTLLRDAVQWIVLRGPAGLLRALPLFPLRDALVTAAWIATPFFRHVSWRGNRVLVGEGTRLYAEVPSEEPRLLSVEG